MEYDVTMNGKELEYLDVWQIINSPEQSDWGGVTITNLLVDWMECSNEKGFFIGKDDGTLEMYEFIHKH